MRGVRDHPLELAALAFTIAAAAVVAIAGAYGFSAFGDAWRDLHWPWLALTISAGLLAMPAYALAYRTVAHFDGGPKLGLALVLRIVAAGFGTFAPGGGFTLDKAVLHAVHNDERDATVRVLGLGMLEWVVLAPAACIGAIVLLATGATHPMPSVLWPWAVAVPVGFTIGFSVATDRRCRRAHERGGRRKPVAHLLAAIRTLRRLALSFASCWPAWIGAALYWALDIASFYGALRFIGLHVGLAGTIVTYATGYALTRRSMPLGGAGVTEALMTFSLHWMGFPVASALAAVVVYRVVNFVIPTVPALLAHPRVKPLLDAADEGRAPAVPRITEATSRSAL